MQATHDVMSQFRRTFRLEELIVQERQGWTLSVRPAQITLGSMVLSSSRGHLDFQDFDDDDSLGMARMIAVAERLAKGCFGAERINLACLMMKDPVVHYHVLPRYSSPVERYGRVWIDEDWPRPPQFRQTSSPDAILRTIQDELTTALLS
jgi:diadenosine tetraphosphate (Ap4A) HIT family hydrolase